MNISVFCQKVKYRVFLLEYGISKLFSIHIKISMFHWTFETYVLETVEIFSSSWSPSGGSERGGNWVAALWTNSRRSDTSPTQNRYPITGQLKGQLGNLATLWNSMQKCESFPIPYILFRKVARLRDVRIHVEDFLQFNLCLSLTLLILNFIDVFFLWNIHFCQRITC